MSYYFSSESVSEGHPDKVADAISDAILDTVLASRDPAVRMACETLVTTNRVIVAGEYRGELNGEVVDRVIRDTIQNIGYEQSGFDWRTVEITNLLHGQSADIALGTDNFGAGDQGIMFGYACRETETLMPSAIYWSHRIVEGLARLRKSGDTWLGPDAKSQVTMIYDDNARPIAIDKVVCSTQHSDHLTTAEVRARVETVIRGILPDDLVTDETQFLINPTGRFVIGGPDGDTGLTGRKIIVDTYGGAAPHAGGAFSGKDPTKVDRSAAYMARYLAKNIVASGHSDWATVQLSYAIGVHEPTSLYVECENQTVARDLTEWIRSNVDLTPTGIINRFNLFRPIYSQTVAYGHFGKPGLPWESTNLF